MRTACLWGCFVGSKSSAVDTNTTNNTSLQLSRDAITESGTQILDSIIVDPSDATMKALIASMEADFEVLVSGQKAGIGQLIDLGKEVLNLADKNQITMADMSQTTLRNSLAWMEEQQAMGRYVIDFSANTVKQSYDFAGDALSQNGAALKQALDIAADVKTGDFADTLKSISTAVMIFALVAIYISRK